MINQDISWLIIKLICHDQSRYITINYQANHQVIVDPCDRKSLDDLFISLFRAVMLPCQNRNLCVLGRIRYLGPSHKGGAIKFVHVSCSSFSPSYWQTRGTDSSILLKVDKHPTALTGLSATFRVGGDLGRVGGAWRRPQSAGHSRPEPQSSEGWINWGTWPDRGVWAQTLEGLPQENFLKYAFFQWSLQTSQFKIPF